MTTEEILKLRDHGEVSKVQFKERIFDKYDIGCELVALSNTHGGKLVLVTKKSDLVTNLDTEKPNLVTERPVLVTNLDTKTPNLVTQRRILSNKEKDIVNFCSVPRTAKEILDRIGVTNQTKNREKYVVSLIEAGYLVMTNPDNPNASNQKYKRKITVMNKIAYHELSINIRIYPSYKVIRRKL